MNVIDWTAVGSFATALMVGAAAIQIWLGTKQAKIKFEDGLVKEYRDLLAQMPVDVLLQKESALEYAESHLALFYRYIDLCNEQVFLRTKGRIQDDTWQEWRAGILSNLSRPGFDAAWKAVQKKTLSFMELRCLFDCALDPKSKRWAKHLKELEKKLREHQLAVPINKDATRGDPGILDSSIEEGSF
ncbi:MAG: hypothetical protein ABI718_08065 [Acidobacteriota bacterium]